MILFGYKKFAIYLQGCALLIASCLLLSACGGDENKEPPPPGVTVITLEPKNIPITGEFVGQTAGYREVEVRSQVSGILQKRAYTEGQVVKQGDLLFQIDPAPYQAALNQAKGNLSQAEARLYQARLDNDRFIKLYSEAAVSKKERDDAVAAYKAAQGDAASARAMVDDAQINLGYTTVLAPISGSTSEETVSEGNLINVGQMLTKLVQLDPLYVNFSIPSTDVLRFRDMIKRGILVPPPENKFRVEIKLSNGAIYGGSGELNFVDPRVDPSTSSIKARAQLENTDDAILPGQFARVYMKGYMLKDALAVPQRAVLSTQDGPMIYVLDDKNIANLRPVVQELTVNNEYVLRQGAKPGERIVVDGIMKVRPGKPVQVVDPKAQTSANATSSK